MLTGEQSYLDDALRLYAWTNATLQDPNDGLYYDNINLSGHIDKVKLTYNTALMIRANCLFYMATGKPSYLAEAKTPGRGFHPPMGRQRYGRGQGRRQIQPPAPRRFH